MIKLKTEVNKSAVMRELQARAIEEFKDSWQSELQVQAYMNGVHDLFKLLRLEDVVGRSEQFVCECCADSFVDEDGDWCQECLDNPSRVIIN